MIEGERREWKGSNIGGEEFEGWWWVGKNMRRVVNTKEKEKEKRADG